MIHIQNNAWNNILKQVVGVYADLYKHCLPIVYPTKLKHNEAQEM